MLHHRRKLDREGARQLPDGHASLLIKTREDRPPRRVNKGRESAVELRSRKLYHVVKYYANGGPVKGGSRRRSQARNLVFL